MLVEHIIIYIYTKIKYVVVLASRFQVRLKQYS
jgi:hypothetical protein